MTKSLQRQPTRYQVGTFIKTSSPHVVEVLGTTALDFAVLDAEHAPLDRAALDLMMLAGRAAGLPLLVRIPDRQPSTILSVLDIGAAGLLVFMVWWTVSGRSPNEAIEEAEDATPPES